MTENYYKYFKKSQLNKFIKYYKESFNASQKRELKQSLYDNQNLTFQQKNNLWERIIKGDIEV